MVKNLPINAGDTGEAGWIPRSGRSPGVGNGNPLQDSCLGNPTDRGTYYPWGRKKWDRIERLNTHTHTHTHSCLELSFICDFNHMRTRRWRKRFSVVFKIVLSIPILPFKTDALTNSSLLRKTQDSLFQTLPSWVERRYLIRHLAFL